PNESLRVAADYIGDVIIQPSRKIERIVGFRPITEHHRHGREHLHGNFVAIHFFNPLFWVPNVVCDFAKDAVTDHHSRATWFVVIEPDESWVAVFGVEIGPIPRKNVGVEVDLHWWIEQSPARCHFKLRSCKLKIGRRSGRSTLERFYRLRLRDFSA